MTAQAARAARGETAANRVIDRAHQRVRENHSEGLHTDHRDYCPDCRYERAVGDERR